MKAGSPSLFFLIKMVNLLFGICSLALIALGVWLWNQFHNFSFLDLCFIGLGLFEFLLVLLIWSAKTSVVKYSCTYLGFVFFYSS